MCRAIDHHWEDDKFATAGAAVDIWDHSRSEPISTYSWGADSVLSVRFNPVSVHICSCLSCHGSGWIKLGAARAAYRFPHLSALSMCTG